MGRRSENRLIFYFLPTPRDYTTLFGTLNLRVPRTRDGRFSTEIFERYQRNEKDLLLTILEMYIQGGSTRKIWKNIIEENIPNAKFLYQQDNDTFMEISRYSSFPFFLPILLKNYLILDLPYVLIL